MTSANESGALLEVRGLSVEYATADGWLRVIDEVNLDIHPAETLGLVGESGCGKSTTALSILRLHPSAGRVRVRGEIRYAGRDILDLDLRRMRGLRGSEIAMIPQDPFSSLNPLFTIGNQVREVLRVHGRTGRRQLHDAAVRSLERVRLDRPEQRLRQYPHELSGGMRQRAVGAIATACDPRLLIADEPTTALDVTVQSEYLDMLMALQRDSGLSMLFITHDLGVVSRICDRVAIMYAGRIVETGDVTTVFRHPAHWYTRGLLECTPSPDAPQQRLSAIRGAPPRPGTAVTGCRFAGRCDAAQDRCRRAEPALGPHRGGHYVRCWYPVPGANA